MQKADWTIGHVHAYRELQVMAIIPRLLRRSAKSPSMEENEHNSVQPWPMDIFPEEVESYLYYAAGLGSSNGFPSLKTCTRTITFKARGSFV